MFSEETRQKLQLKIKEANLPWVNWFNTRLGWTEFDHNVELSKGWKYTTLSKYDSVIGIKNSWCSMSLCTGLETNGLKSTHSAAAKSYATFGKECGFTTGAILPIRHASGKHHVNIFIMWYDEAKLLAYCIGGNQSNSINISIYDLSGNEKGHDELITTPRWPSDFKSLDKGPNDNFLEEETVIKAPDVGTPITSGQDPDEGTLKWYERMINKCQIDKGYEAAVESDAKLIYSGKERYSTVAKILGIPWWVIGIIHFKEGSCNFQKCLANGEKIIGTGRKTTLVPKGLGPWKTWEASAIDILTIKKFNEKDLTRIENILHTLERYNGTGYITGAGKAETSPYLWARTNINDDFGKYVSDGKFNPEQETNKTSGAAAIIKSLLDQGLLA